MKRQKLTPANQLIATTPNSVISRSICMQSGEHDKLHSHPWHQLIYPHRGVLKTLAQDRLFYVPSNRLVLIPANCSHESWAVSPVEFIGVYMSPELITLEDGNCRTVEVSTFLRELILEVVPAGDTPLPHDDKTKRLCQVLCDQISGQKEVSLDVIIPQDRRVKPIVDELLNLPHSSTKLSSWASKVGASQRTISRIFENQTGLTFRRWRQRMRLINSLPLLERGLKIQAVASTIGYDSPSAFIYSFRQEFGVTPGQYFN